MLSLPRSLTGLIPTSASRSVVFRIKNARLTSTEVNAQEQSEEFMDEAEQRTTELEAKKNKSRLRTKHYDMLHGKMPVDINNPEFKYHESVQFHQKLAARYGASSGVNFGVAWPTKQELNDILEYETVTYPFTLQEMIEKKKIQREEQRKKLVAREKEIELKVSKLTLWLKELEDRKQKKLAAAREAQERKDRLIEEVRQHFGYVINMKDPKFQEMLEQKEKEQRKAEKDQKKKQRYEKVSEKAKLFAEKLEKQAGEVKSVDSK